MRSATALAGVDDSCAGAASGAPRLRAPVAPKPDTPVSWAGEASSSSDGLYGTGAAALALLAGDCSSLNGDTGVTDNVIKSSAASSAPPSRSWSPSASSLSQVCLCCREATDSRRGKGVTVPTGAASFSMATAMMSSTRCVNGSSTGSEAGGDGTADVVRRGAGDGGGDDTQLTGEVTA